MSEACELSKHEAYPATLPDVLYSRTVSFMRVVFGLLLVVVLVVLGHKHHDHGYEPHDAHDVEDTHDFSHLSDEQVFELTKPKSFQHAHEGDHDSDALQSVSDTWASAVFASMFIGIAPIFILFCIPTGKSQGRSHSHGGFLNTMLAFAAGGLLGDVFLHILPHSAAEDAREHSHHDHGHSHGLWGYWVIAGLLAFFAIDKTVRSFSRNGSAHSHGHSGKRKKDDDHDSKHKKKQGDRSKSSEIEPRKDLVASRYLNIAADVAHNFTDGLALGAAFCVGHAVALSTVLAIFLHEVPHEIGDFVLLIQSGLRRRTAMLIQLMTAISAVAGTVFGLVVERQRAQDSVSWIMPFTAGGFIYIATVSIIPELLEDSRSRWQSFKELLAFGIGVGFMVLVTFLE